MSGNSVENYSGPAVDVKPAVKQNTSGVIGMALTKYRMYICCPRHHLDVPSRTKGERVREGAGCRREVDTERVHVVIMADDKLLIGMMTLANSIVTNTRSDVMFHFVTFPEHVMTIRNWITGSVLKNISYEILAFSKSSLDGKFLVRSPRGDLASPLNFARIFLPQLLPCVGKVIFMDADCLVLGDVAELYATKLKPRHVVAGYNMCNTFENPKEWPMSGLVFNETNPHVKAHNLPMDTCMMNAGVIVADLNKWEHRNISKQLQFWMELNVRETVFNFGDHGSGSQAVMMAVVHDKYTGFPKAWNTMSGRGHRTTKRPKLVHWNGSRKPWLYPHVVPFAKDWLAYYVPDPSGRHRLPLHNKH